jgi:hypothetical protein
MKKIWTMLMLAVLVITEDDDDYAMFSCDVLPFYLPFTNQ